MRKRFNRYLLSVQGDKKQFLQSKQRDT